MNTQDSSNTYIEINFPSFCSTLKKTHGWPLDLKVFYQRLPLILSTCLLGVWVGGLEDLGLVYATCWKWHLKGVRRLKYF